MALLEDILTDPEARDLIAKVNYAGAFFGNQGQFIFSSLFLGQIPGVDPSMLAHWLSTPPRFTVARKNPLVDEDGGGCSVEKKVQMLIEKVGFFR